MNKYKNVAKLIFEFLTILGLIGILSLIFSVSRNTYQASPNTDYSNAYPGPYPPAQTQESKQPSVSPEPTNNKPDETLVYPLTPTPQVDNNGWFIYTDKDVGFSFSYPPDMVTNVSGGPKSVNVAFRLPGLDHYEGMAIQIHPNPTELSVNEFAKYIYEQTSQQPAPANFTEFSAAKEVTISGQTALKLTIPSFVSEFLIMIPHGKYILIVGPEHDAVITESNPKTIELIYQILDTFSFASSN